MTEDTQETHIARLRTISLTRSERLKVRDEVVAYMKFHPIRVLPSPRFTKVEKNARGWFSYHLSWMATGFAVIAVLVGSVTYAAEGSVPGNTLYQVKVGFTEEVRGWFAFSDEAKAVWEARRAERRLEEAEQLALSGELSEETRTTLALHLETHAKAAVERLGRLASSNGARVAARVSSELESSLRAHEHILLSFENEVGKPDAQGYASLVAADTATGTGGTASVLLKQNIETSDMHVSPLVAQVRLSIEDIMSVRVQAESGVSGAIEDISLDDEFRRAAEAIAAARTLLGDREDNVKSSIATEAALRLQRAEEALADAEVAIQEQKQSEALTLLRTSIRAANVARILAQKSLYLDVSPFFETEILNNSEGRGPSNTTTPLKQASSTPSTQGQGASVIDILIGTDINTEQGSSSVGAESNVEATSSTESSTSSSVNTENSAKVKTEINVKVNTGS